MEKQKHRKHRPFVSTRNRLGPISDAQDCHSSQTAVSKTKCQPLKQPSTQVYSDDGMLDSMCVSVCTGTQRYK